MQRTIRGPRGNRLLPLWVSALLTLGWGLAMLGFPLVNALGYEFSLAANVFLTVLGGYLFSALLTRHRDSSRAARFLLVLRSAGVILGLLLFSGLVGTYFHGSCNLIQGLGFFFLQPGITALFCALLALALDEVSRNRVLQVLGYYVVVVSMMLVTAAKILFDPVIFGFDHLLGYLPGAIYDEVLLLESRLIYFRAYTAVLGMVLFLAAYLYGGMRSQGGVFLGLAGRKRSAALFFVLTFVVLGFFLFQEDFGFHTTREGLQRALGARAVSEHFTVYYPPASERIADRIGEVLADHEFRRRQIAQTLELGDSVGATTYLYPDESTKHRLMGARTVMIGDFFNRELHLDHDLPPHPLLTHELTHVLASSIAPEFTGAPLNACLVEGLAVAVAWLEEAVDPHQLAKALMDRRGELDILELFSPLHFFSTSAREAYTACGSFVRFLLDAHGPIPLKSLYAGGTLEQAYGMSSETLAGAWRAFLSRLEVSPRVADYAELLTSRKTLFTKRCARECANLAFKAEQAEQHGALTAAAALYQRAYELSGGYPSHGEELLAVWLRLDERHQARTLCEELLAREGLPQRYRMAALLGRADLDFLDGDLGAATEGWKGLVAADFSLGNRLQAKFRLLAVGELDQRNRLAGLLAGREAFLPGYRDLLRRAINAERDTGFASYLLGRSFHLAAHWEEAVDALKGLLEHPLAIGEEQRDGLVRLGSSYFHLGRWVEARDIFSRVFAAESDAFERLRLKDWTDRIDWSEERASRKLDPKAAIR
ncbi:MAG: hypothetical protein A2284_05165 [Deltaproteobacteria bacterium RIFOXYA12_FULL_61_11]|nr:MAG: hypothetical protein A2284_05165 [Deltaproteobacteria bacterium RIFOXYA12_FULL_61_11]